MDGSLLCARVLCVTGPTASGKSALADELAVRLSTSVLSADAMQVYRGMDVGTAKTPVAERRAPLLGIDLAEPDDTYSVARYMDVAHAAVDGMLARGRVAVVCGGTGLYVRAALEDMDFSSGEQVGNEVRERYERMAEELGPKGLHALLAQRDPASAELIHPNNVRRVVRAFEMLEQGESYAEKNVHLREHKNRHPSLVVALDMPREALYARIDARVDAMMERGLVDEVRGLVARGMGESLTSRQAIGYKEIIAALSGACTLDEAVEDIKRGTRRYAKRQLTWLRADERVRWLDATKPVCALADEVLALAATPEAWS